MKERCARILPRASRTVAVYSVKSVGRGKSGLQRAGCQVTPGKRELTESATENIPPHSTVYGL